MILRIKTIFSFILAVNYLRFVIGFDIDQIRANHWWVLAVEKWVASSFVLGKMYRWDLGLDSVGGVFFFIFR